MKKLIIYTLTNLLIITSAIAQTQNSIWSLPPNYKSTTIQVLPAPGGSIVGTETLDNYQPFQQAEYMHNAMQDVSGNLLFFIVDGHIYDKDGYIIAVMNEGGTFGGVYTEEIVGYVETLIIPVPDNCNQYYIVASNSSGMSSHGVNSVYYSILDLSLTSYETGRKGVLLDPLNPTSQAYWSSDNTFDLSTQAPNFAYSESEPNTAMAVTELNTATNQRFLYINGDEALFRFIVTSNGIFYDTYNYILTISANGVPNISDVSSRSEMEIINTSLGYRLAMSYANFSCSSCTPQISQGNTVLVAEINSLGDITSTSYEVLPSVSPLLKASVKGMEFSPNGNYLYITHDPNNVATTNQTPFKIYDVVSQTFLSNTAINNTQMLSDIDNLDFYKSQIELSGESNVPGGRMYLVNGNNLATIDNVDNPNSTGLLWNNSAQTVSYNLNTYNFPTTDFEKHIYILPDQIDGMNYTDHFTADLECCKENSPYDISVNIGNNNYSGTVTWDGNSSSNNPWGWTTSPNGVTVKDKMVISTGANITINNMRFEFAPDAQLIIENGARLTINGTTLTVDDRCATNVMWDGVEVWGGGPGTLQQIVAGEFRVQNNSLIEHAIEGAVNFNHAASPSNANNGGIIIATTGTKFRNNAQDIVFNAYQSIFFGNPYNDRSYFSDVTFITESSLKDPSYNNFITHVTLNDVTGIKFSGCDFENTDVLGSTYSYLNRGTGILAYNAKFTVAGRCISSNIPCTSYDEGNFINLTRGVSASNSTLRSQIADISRNNFENVWRGIYLYNMEPPKVILNDFNVGASYPFNGNESYGLYLFVCSGYIVENNNFNTTHNGYFGVYVNHSGTAPNEIYRNTFTNLIVGSQAANINGDNMGTNGTGLEFRCNIYENTRDYDILVSSGLVKDDHGSCISSTSPSNNQFSYDAQYGDFWINNSIPPFHTYSYSPSTLQTAPRPAGIGFNNNNTLISICSSLPYNQATSCPDRQTGGIMLPPLFSLQMQYDSINDLMVTKDVNLLKQLQQDLTIVKTKMERVKNDTIRTMLAGTKNSDGKKEVISFLQQNKKYNTINDEKLLVELLIATNNISAAKSKIAEIQAIKGTKNFVDFSNIVIALNQTPTKTKSLLTDTSLLEQVVIIAASKENDNSVAAATVLLKSLNVIDYKEPIEIVTPSKSFERTSNQNQSEETSEVSIYPNPTKEQFTLTHNYSLENGNLMLTIYDLMGRALITEQVTSDQMVINTSPLKSGVYFYHITQNEKQLNIGKLVIE